MTSETGRLDGNTSVTSTIQNTPLSGRKNQSLDEMGMFMLILHSWGAFHYAVHIACARLLAVRLLLFFVKPLEPNELTDRTTKCIRCNVST